MNSTAVSFDEAMSSMKYPIKSPPRLYSLSFTSHFVSNLDSHFEEAFSHLIGGIVRFISSILKIPVTFYLYPSLISISLK